MKHNISALALMGIFAALILSCEMSKKKETEKEKPAASWSASMQGLARDVYNLIPYVYSREKFFQKENHSYIRKSLERLASEGHKISPKMGEAFLGEDPLLRFSLTSLQSDLNRALASFDSNHLEYSRNTVKTVLGHCFRCHSVVKAGSKAPWKLEGIEQLQLTPTEKIDLLVAGRQYEEALRQAQKNIRNTNFMQAKPFEYEDVLKQYVALVARWQQKPGEALALVEWVSEQGKLPGYLLGQIQAWEKSLQDWDRNSVPLKKLSASALIQQATTRMEKAKDSKEFSKDHAGDVEYLRASIYLHEALRKPISEADRGRTYYLLGEIYESLNELGSWNLHEAYYEQCIRQFPGTQRAKECYRRLEASVYFGYSGSSGVHIPSYEKERLNTLKSLSSTKP